MSGKAVQLAGTLACASAMFLLTADPSQAAGHGGGGGGHGGGGHGGGGGGFHGGGFHGGGFHGGGFHGGGFRAGGGRGGGRGWHGGGWGRRGYYGGFYGGFYPGWYGGWDYPYNSYGYTDYPYNSYGNSDYPSYGYSDSYYDPNYYPPLPPAGIASEYGTDAPPAATDSTAHLTVRVPPDAQLWFQDTLTKQRGSVREFQSPQLPVGGEYTYDIHARWRQGDHEVDQTRHVTVHAGSNLSVDFTTPALDQTQATSSPGTSEP